MVKKSKVGSTGRFGARYGRKAKRTVKDVEDKMHKKHIC
ncbi:MAG: 50S ribosomal protein L37ae, partial [Methanosphaera sp.]